MHCSYATLGKCRKGFCDKQLSLDSDINVLSASSSESAAVSFIAVSARIQSQLEGYTRSAVGLLKSM